MEIVKQYSISHFGGFGIGRPQWNMREESILLGVDAAQEQWKSL